MQIPDWEENDSVEFVDAGQPRPVAETALRSARDKVRTLQLRRRLEERLDSKRIEMEFGYEYLDDDESIQ